jgi:hypothetical protein
MARRPKPENETIEQEADRQLLEAVANSSDRSEKTSWNRKLDNMVGLLAQLAPIEDQIIELQAQKMPIFDKVQILREAMVGECIHPYQYLVKIDEGVALCKFCNRKINARVK